MALFGTKTDIRDGGVPSPSKKSWEQLESQMQTIMDQYDVWFLTACHKMALFHIMLHLGH